LRRRGEEKREYKKRKQEFKELCEKKEGKE